MKNIYKTIESFCKTKGITITTMCREAMVSRSSLTDFKKGRIKTLSFKTLSKIADHFMVTVDCLVNGINENSSVSSKALNKEISLIDLRRMGQIELIKLIDNGELILSDMLLKDFEKTKWIDNADHNIVKTVLLNYKKITKERGN